MLSNETWQLFLLEHRNHHFYTTPYYLKTAHMLNLRYIEDDPRDTCLTSGVCVPNRPQRVVSYYTGRLPVSIVSLLLIFIEEHVSNDKQPRGQYIHQQKCKLDG
jgi:hypothetical protein